MEKQILLNHFRSGEKVYLSAVLEMMSMWVEIVCLLC